jgi:hypothetical protein
VGQGVDVEPGVVLEHPIALGRIGRDGRQELHGKIEVIAAGQRRRQLDGEERVVMGVGPVDGGPLDGQVVYGHPTVAVLRVVRVEPKVKLGLRFARRVDVVELDRADKRRERGLGGELERGIDRVPRQGLVQLDGERRLELIEQRHVERLVVDLGADAERPELRREQRDEDG